jgi:hypothetical protein
MSTYYFVAASEAFLTKEEPLAEVLSEQAWDVVSCLPERNGKVDNVEFNTPKTFPSGNNSPVTIRHQIDTTDVKKDIVRIFVNPNNSAQDICATHTTATDDNVKSIGTALNERITKEANKKRNELKIARCNAAPKNSKNGFDLSKEDEQKKCFHFTNLQPLWKEENFKKSRSLI